ncbi:hypothetical protein BDP27DRAFT_1376838 [Rhodocollybia butyracea]|uniref:Uncharacterized protein n=1 Tax=Rhodocollybia butyracea TaxID=206335 RepID=A0A9P5TUN9_9AGAR|nr:hypothetical protein BDP27DRAFT_1376838 [Rhodocollybia butyracea]
MNTQLQDATNTDKAKPVKHGRLKGAKSKKSASNQADEKLAALTNVLECMNQLERFATTQEAENTKLCQAGKDFLLCVEMGLATNTKDSREIYNVLLLRERNPIFSRYECDWATKHMVHQYLKKQAQDSVQSGKARSPRKICIPEGECGSARPDLEEAEEKRKEKGAAKENHQCLKNLTSQPAPKFVLGSSLSSSSGSGGDESKEERNDSVNGNAFDMDVRLNFNCSIKDVILEPAAAYAWEPAPALAAIVTFTAMGPVSILELNQVTYLKASEKKYVWEL